MQCVSGTKILHQAWKLLFCSSRNRQIHTWLLSCRFLPLAKIAGRTMQKHNEWSGHLFYKNSTVAIEGLHSTVDTARLLSTAFFLDCVLNQGPLIHRCCMNRLLCCSHLNCAKRKWPHSNSMVKATKVNQIFDYSSATHNLSQKRVSCEWIALYIYKIRSVLQSHRKWMNGDEF